MLGNLRKVCENPELKKKKIEGDLGKAQEYLGENVREIYESVTGFGENVTRS